jgi:hypothetical protein
MKLQKRIKRIVSLTVEDFYNSGYSTDESPKSLNSWLCDALMQDESIEDLHTYQISILILDMLKSLDLVDLDYIHSVVFEDNTQASEVSITFSKVVL